MLNDHGWKPSEWLELSYREKVLVVAATKFKDELEEKERKKAEREAKR